MSYKESPTVFGPPGTELSKEERLWCMSNPQECYDLSPGDPELVLGTPIDESELVGTASAEAESRKNKSIFIGIAVLAVGGTLVYIFTKKKRR